MLPSKNRLTREKDFKKISTSGKSFFSPLFRVKIIKNNLEQSRFGFVISTKVSKKAVERNRLKRQLREIIRLNLDKVTPGFDVMISVNSKTLKESYQELENKLLFLLRKAKLV
jgi:ribonuclease P protein component